MLRRSFTLLLLCSASPVLAQTPVSAHAHAPQQPAPVIEINLPLTLEQRYLGDLGVYLGSGSVSFDGSRFIDLIGSELDPSIVDALSARIVDGRLTPETASNENVEVRYDPAQQEIQISVSLSARARRVIQIQGRPDVGVAAPIAPAEFSAFVNLGAAYEYIWESPNADNSGSQPVGGFIDVGGRIGGESGVAFISRQSFDSGPGRTVQRNQTQLIYDDIERLIRVTAGDLQYRGASFQTLPRVAGVAVERYFGLEPNYVYRPFAQNQFELDRSATVEVQVNGATIRQLRLDPGRYDLRDLPLSQGANNVDIVIRDDTGRTQTLSSRRFFDLDLLGEGVSDFSLAAGVRTNIDDGIIRYSDDWAASGYYLRGVSSVLTAGGDAQFDSRGGTVGAAVIWASPIGVWRLQAAGSHRKEFGSGMGVDVGYRATGRFGAQDWRWSVDLGAQYYSPNFTTLSDFALRPGGAPTQPFANSVTANFQVSNQRWSITGNGQYNRGRGTQRDTASAIAGANYALTPRLTVGGFGTYTRAGDRSNVGVLLQITFRPGRKDLVRATYDTARREGSLNYRHSESTYVGDTSYEVGLRRNAESDFAAVTGSLFHAGNRFEATAQHDVFSTANFASDDRIQTSRLSMGSSIVFAGGKFAIGRPVQESFAVISPHRTLAGKEIRLDPSEQGYRARTDFLGSAVVPDLTTFGRTFIYYDVEDLPLGYALGSGEFTLKPPLYSGYDLTVGSDATYTVLAMVVRGGEPVALVGGALHSLDRPQDDPVPAFTNRNGRLAASGLRPGRYRLELLTESPFSTEIVVTETGTNLLNLGEIRIP